MGVARDPSFGADYLRSILRYEPDTGHFYRVARCSGTRIGAKAGSINAEGYVVIRVRGRRRVAAHRLAWLYMTGNWPADEVDHRDLDRANNRWSNLREATHGQNKSNSRVYRHTFTRLKGAYPSPSHPSKFVAAIKKDGKRIHLGTFDSAVEAHEAYSQAAQQLHGEFRRAS